MIVLANTTIGPATVRYFQSTKNLRIKYFVLSLVLTLLSTGAMPIITAVGVWFGFSNNNSLNGSQALHLVDSLACFV